MENQVDPVARLGVQDKRHLFMCLMALTDRILFLNKFPADQYDFALSCLPPDVEDAYRLLEKELPRTIASQRDIKFRVLHAPDEHFLWKLHNYPDEDGYAKAINFPICGRLELHRTNRFVKLVDEWCVRQARLEDQVIRTCRVIKHIVHACNTVGQYQRVSPELITFLPIKYKEALKGQTKKSPYPQTSLTQEDIDTAMATLAFASLQNEHSSEMRYNRDKGYKYRSYRLAEFPRSATFDNKASRRLEI